MLLFEILGVVCLVAVGLLLPVRGLRDLHADLAIGRLIDSYFEAIFLDSNFHLSIDDRLRVGASATLASSDPHVDASSLRLGRLLLWFVC